MKKGWASLRFSNKNKQKVEGGGGEGSEGVASVITDGRGGWGAI